MKAYTDVSQSKKLAEILPHTSADGTWEKVSICGAKVDIPEDMQYRHKEIPFFIYSGIGVPCWSLVALLDILPSSTLDSSNDHHYRLHCMERFSEWYDNPVDACVEMIIELHEQKIL